MPPAISENIEMGSTALSAASANSAGLRPKRSDSRPTTGVTRITATAAIVDSHSASVSLILPAELRKAGT